MDFLEKLIELIISLFENLGFLLNIGLTILYFMHQLDEIFCSLWTLIFNIMKYVQIFFILFYCSLLICFLYSFGSYIYDKNKKK